MPTDFIRSITLRVRHLIKYIVTHYRRINLFNYDYHHHIYALADSCKRFSEYTNHSMLFSESEAIYQFIIHDAYALKKCKQLDSIIEQQCGFFVDRVKLLNYKNSIYALLYKSVHLYFNAAASRFSQTYLNPSIRIKAKIGNDLRKINRHFNSSPKIIF